jgi:prepilin-type N-terminal cleavage/methylation domain-containing protein
MKIQKSQRRDGGFSLMELIVVVAIIVILAGLTLGGFSLVNQKTARDTAKVQLKLIENALETYNSDNRSYPPNPDPMGERGDEVLYKYLYYDGFEARDSGGVVYMPEFDPENNAKSGQKWMQGLGAQARIVDPWGNFYRYRSGDSPGAQNPEFDLWSMGADGKTNADPKHKDCADDIKNF